ncbi:MAG TPA: hypothetical protein VHO25_00980, partial [Polyangiaceae bacterium]|nr:hypothetical protein [Polyangiaceae bacterium]
MLLAIVRSATVTRLPSLALGAGLGALLLFAPAAANAHDVTVDGASSEWSTLSTAYANLGFIARTEALTGEYIFWDVTYDQWTETTQEYDLDLEKIQVTGNSGSLFFLLSVDGTDPGVAQYQISIDLDCISGSGQNALAGSAETTVNAAAEWEYLVQTTFHDSGSTGARVLDTSFNVVAGAVLAEATAGIVEIGVPWTQLGLTGPPSTPIRITVSSYRSSANSPTVYDIAGAAQSNVFDAMSDCGDPRWRYYTSNFNCEVSDKDIDFFTELTFEADGDVIAPILLDRMVLNSSLTTGSAGLWVAIRNVTSSTIQLGNFKLGNEKVVDPRFGSGELATFPAGATLAPGATYIVGVEGTMYQTRYGELPDAEFESTSAAPNMTTYAPWFSDLVASGYSLNDGVGEVLVVDPSNTILDVLPYGLGTFPGVTPLTSSGPDETVVFRTVPNVDTDNCNLDFSMSTKPACADTASCAEICMTCNLNTCTPVAVGTSCPDSLSC